ncbi:hypothetical protein NBRC116493_22690 [Aurantivibrio infirmus]
MKKLTLVLMTFVFVSMPALAFAEGRVAVFNLQAAIINTDAAQVKIKAFQENAEFAEMKAKYESIIAELQKMDQDEKTNGVTWAQDKKIEHRKQMDYKRADLENEAKKLKNENDRFLQGILQESAQSAQAVVQELIKSEGIGLILNAEAVVFADSSYDITAKITDRLNKAK